MTMKCPVCGGALEKKYSFSGDLYQTNDCQYVCNVCGYRLPTEETIAAQVANNLDRKREDTKCSENIRNTNTANTE